MPDQDRRPSRLPIRGILLGFAVVLIAAFLAFTTLNRHEDDATGTPATEQSSGSVTDEPQTPTATSAPTTSGTPPASRTQATPNKTTSAPPASDQQIRLGRRAPNDPLALGKSNAPVVMHEFADFRCPFCGVFARETLPTLMTYVNNGTLRIEFHDDPIFGEQSEAAANAARAAGAQGRFWEYYQAVFAAAPARGHADLTTAKLLAFGKQAKVRDYPKFEQAVRGNAYRKAVEADAQLSAAIAVPSTPAFVINGTPLLGAQPTSVFVKKIESAAASK